MSGELPAGWVEVPLADIATMVLGKMLDRNKNSGTSKPYLRNINVRWGTVDLSDVQEMLFEDHEADRFGLEDGDVLVCEGGEPGRAAVWRGQVPDMRFQKAIHRVRCGSGLDPDWLVWNLFRGAKLGRLSEFFTGTGISHLTGVSLAKVPIVVPPVQEQARIIGRLDELRARSKKAREALDEVPALLDKLKQSVLAAAFRGDLTAAWRAAHPDVEPASVLLDRIRAERRRRWEEANPKKRYVEPEPVDTDGLSELPEGWGWASMEELTTLVTSGSRAWSKYYDTGIGVFIMAGNVRKGRLDLGEVQRVGPPDDDSERVRTQVEAGDLLVTIVGANTGDACVVDRPLPEHYVCQSVALARPVLPELGALLGLYFQPGAGGFGAFEEIMYGQGRPHIGLDELRSCAVAVPPTDEWNELIDAVGAFNDRLGVLVATHVDLSRLVPQMDQSILAKAFRGELVPQDPNDEPAKALLARVRASAGEPVKKGRGRPAKG